MRLRTIFKTNLQVFAAVAWLVAIGLLAHSMRADLEAAQKAPTNAVNEKADIVELYLAMMALTTGVCLGAWGIRFPMGSLHRIGEPFEVGDKKKSRREKKYRG